MRSNGLLTSLTGAMLFAATPASAVVIAEYKFQSGAPASADNSSSDSESTTSALDVTYGQFANAATVPAVEHVAALSVANANETLALAKSDGDYVSFQITGTSFEITSITFDYALTDTGNDNDYTYHVLSDQDSFTDAIVDGGTGTIVGDGGALSTTANVNGAELGTITGGITFRIYVTDDRSSGGFHTIDNIVVNGTPEPGSLALLGLGGAFLLWHRRRV